MTRLICADGPEGIEMKFGPTGVRCSGRGIHRSICSHIGS
ncbi:hypothetical protein [Ralstonia phage RSL2]|uniref:Uncharacterized protein n=1 Tax=Ralstonia phage RSL2 TaxID=1585840 RepID=A0A146I5A1_9CAUD|nr:hypothetical protein [Ralstonia phage RSL2]